jgi:hypothetical protein
VRRHDEQEFGEYRTKRLVLERYEEYGEGMRRDGAAVGRNTAGTIVKSEVAAFRQSAVAERVVPSGDFPAMPALLNIARLVENLVELDVVVDNQRPERGLMVYRTKDEFGKLAEHLKRGGVEYWFHPKGTKFRLGEQFELDPGKRLG